MDAPRAFTERCLACGAAFGADSPQAAREARDEHVLKIHSDLKNQLEETK